MISAPRTVNALPMAPSEKGGKRSTAKLTNKQQSET